MIKQNLLHQMIVKTVAGGTILLAEEHSQDILIMRRIFSRLTELKHTRQYLPNIHINFLHLLQKRLSRVQHHLIRIQHLPKSTSSRAEVKFRVCLLSPYFQVVIGGQAVCGTPAGKAHHSTWKPVNETLPCYILIFFIEDVNEVALHHKVLIGNSFIG